MRKSKGRRFVIYLNPKSESKSFLDFLDFDLDGDFGRETSIMGTIHPLDFLDLEAGFGEDIPKEKSIPLCDLADTEVDGFFG